MRRLLDELPILILRLAVAAILAVSAGGLLVVGGKSWHEALSWVYRIAVPLAVVITALWAWRTLARNE